MKLYLIGDIHGMISEYYLPIISKLENPSIQVGDVGHGMYDIRLPEVPKQHRFIRGNHDNPELCAKHPNYLGNFGYIKEWDLFYVSGAPTPPWALGNFLLGISWWPEEELEMEDCNAALRLYEEVRPRIVVSHTCPQIAHIRIMNIKRHATHGVNKTAALLQAMFESHAPSMWYFGHYHESRKFNIYKTHFQCLDEAEVVGVDI